MHLIGECLSLRSETGGKGTGHPGRNVGYRTPGLRESAKRHMFGGHRHEEVMAVVALHELVKSEASCAMTHDSLPLALLTIKKPTFQLESYLTDDVLRKSLLLLFNTC